MYQILAYIKFLWNSSNQHGVHSPFVYSLVTKCFYNTKKRPSYKTIKAYRKSLLKKHDSISVTDFGAGSRVFKSVSRKISSIAKNAGITPSRARLLNRLIPYLDIKNALEIGTSLGIGTAAMAAGNEVNITTIEGCPETGRIAKEQFQAQNFQEIDLKIGEFDLVLKEVTSASKKPEFDLIYFDGNHQKEATLSYFQTLLPTVHNDTVWIFDDIHWSPEMEQAWEEIKAHPSVKVTIDTFFWGFVFFRREQEKEHFVIRL